MADQEARITALEEQNKALKTLVEDLKKELDAAEKRLDEIEAAAKSGGDAGGKKKKEKKKGGDGGSKKKEEKAPEVAYTEKEMKASIKEGGKKAQDIAGMHDMGGMSYFSITLETCKGDWDLMQGAMDAANRRVDEDADDRKGGAHDVAKCFLSCDDAKHVALLFHVPKPLQEAIGSIENWIEAMTKDIGGKILETTEETAKVIAEQDKDKELFPLKMRDEAINASFRWLKEKKLVPDDDSDEEVDMSEMYENAGVEW